MQKAEDEQTIVFMRSMETPALHWEAPVLYDAWGTPYVAHQMGVPGMDKELKRDGTTSDTWLYGTEWKRKSGPEIKWPEPKPRRPFDGMERA